MLIRFILISRDTALCLWISAPGGATVCHIFTSLSGCWTWKWRLRVCQHDLRVCVSGSVLQTHTYTTDAQSFQPSNLKTKMMTKESWNNTFDHHIHYIQQLGKKTNQYRFKHGSRRLGKNCWDPNLILIITCNHRRAVVITVIQTSECAQVQK